MTNHQLRLHWVLAPSLLLFACADGPPSDDTRPQRPLSTSPVTAAMQLGLTPVALDKHGKPSLLRASQVAPAPAATATESALTHVGRLSAAWGVAETSLPRLQGIGEVPAASGATIARVRQTIDGLPVDRGEMRVMVRDNGELVATNGVLVSADTPRDLTSFSIDDTQAVARAVAHNYKRDFAASALAQHDLRANGSRAVRGRYGDIDVQLARAQKAWHYTGARLIPAWVVEAYASPTHTTNGDAFRTMLTADGSRVLSHKSLVSDVAFRYRVFVNPGDTQPMDGPTNDFSPHPTGQADLQFPSYATSTLVDVDGLNRPGPAGSPPDPWLPSTRTETFGNNADAYTDITAPSGFTFGDFRATVTATTPIRTFDRAYDPNLGPLTSQAQQMAAITNAFYGINWLHDFWYDAGFVEAAGNAQETNTFGVFPNQVDRGGEDRDAMLVETQDNALGGSANNANMSTPRDGLPPRMQIFVWTGRETRNLNILPANRTPLAHSAAFGPVTFDLAAAQVALAVDGTAPVNDGCEPLTNAVAGKIVLVDRGLCTFKRKALNIQTAGGVGMILANNVASVYPFGSLGNDTTIPQAITIPVLSVTQAEGAQIKTELLAGPVTASMRRAPTHQLDGSLDMTLLSHEFGHYLHHRLQDCTSVFCGAQSEGWGDFLAIMSMIKDGDNYDGAYPFSVYTTQNFSFDPGYFGIRRAPFSVNKAINSLSYRHMADGEPLPTNHPLLLFGNNAEVHNAGEIWAQVMMEVYVALLKQPGATFTQTRAKMAKIVVSGLLMAPVDSTPTEMRDALVAAADPADRRTMLEAFARRGMGSCAVSPFRESFDFTGIEESDKVAGHATVGAIELAEVDSCDDDGVVDAGETGTLSLPLANDGHLPLKNVKVTVTSATTGITVVSDPVTFMDFPAGSVQALTFDVKLDKAATGMLPGDFAIKIEGQDGCTSELTISFPIRLNVDESPETSATDKVDATSPWTPAQDELWTQVTDTSGLDRQWHGPDFGGIADARLESPPLKVGTGPFKVTFSHRYSFEYDGTNAWDGGVIEYTTDGGATWADVVTLPGVAPGYTNTIRAGTTNPISGRPGFGSQSAGYPTPTNVTLDFGTQFAGMTVKLRFRIGSDDIVGAEGWFVDDLVFEGITNTPFGTLVEDRATDCGVTPPKPPVDEQPGCCDAGRLRGSSLLLALGVLGLLLRRRRR